jgi:myo-inositol-1(or 4)-monophosphatase
MTAEPRTSEDPRALLPAAFQAADAASRMMRTRKPETLTEKSDRDLVSDVDLAIERAIRHHLAAASPGIAFLGEEEGRTGDPAAGWVWTLDPIDGTSNFAHGLPLCTTSLALLHDGRPVLAVIDAPFLGYRYHAIEGQGAYASSTGTSSTGTSSTGASHPGAGGTRMSVSSISRLRDAVVAIGDYAVGEDADRKNEARLAVTARLASRVHRIRMLGTAALDLAWLAEGRLDASITLGNKPWDTSAGVLIAREAGAEVVDTDGRRHELSSAATIAGPPALIPQLLPLLDHVQARPAQPPSW